MTTLLSGTNTPVVTNINQTSELENNITVETFFKDGPLKITQLDSEFPLKHLITSSAHKHSHLNAINTTQYPNVEATKPYSPEFKRYTGVIQSDTQEIRQVPVFFKITGILDANSLVSGKYYNESTGNSTYERHKKESFRQNTAYTDSLASHLTSTLVEDGTCPHFPRVYGVYKGIAENHYVEFTEEYYDFRRHTPFKKGVNKELWRMVPQLGDVSEDEYDSDMSLDDDDCQLEKILKTLGKNPFEFDDNSFSDEDDSNEKDDDTSSIPSSVHSNDEERFVDVDTCTTVAQDDLETISTDYRVNDDLPIVSTCTDLLDNPSFLTNLESVDAPLAPTRDADFNHQPLYLEMKNVPVQVVAMEAFEHVMEDHLREDFAEIRRCELLLAREDEGKLTASVCAYQWLLKWKTNCIERKWIALLCQVCMALVVMQHRYSMVHNDLHAQNILMEETSLKHLLYRVDGTYYRVPTYGYIIKIIDMGRTTFQLQNTVYMPDVFQPKGEAGEQYTYVHAEELECATGTEGEAEISPNPAFDLSRLACSLIDEFYGGANLYSSNPNSVSLPADAISDECEESEDDWLFVGQKRTVSPLFNMLCEWIADRYNEPVNRYDNFDLYKKIARQMHKTLPIAQLKRPHFAQFKTTDNQVKVDEAFYDLTAVRSEAFATQNTTGYHSDNEVPIKKTSELQRCYVNPSDTDSEDELDYSEFCSNEDSSHALFQALLNPSSPQNQLNSIQSESKKLRINNHHTR